jgi:serine/arginine repetitive matrix protein 2
MASYSQPNNIWGFWGASPGNTHVGQMPGYISASSSAIDSTFLAAHQHAMAIAKQTYQMAVAQQAMAAAADEWERGSAVFRGLGGGGGLWGWGGMYSSGSRSMYAGSVGGPSNWGTASLYGDSIGSMSAHSLPTSAMLPQQVVFPPSFYSSSASEGPQDSVRPRQRTRTAPSSQGIPVLPAQNSAPPSSWKKPRS